VIIGQLILVMVIAGATQAISANVATALFLLYAALNGLLVAPILLRYTQTSVAAAFGVTAGTFAVMSLYGFVTKRDLSALGSILIMALVGLIIASIVNIFVASTMLYWIVTYAGILIFVGFLAFAPRLMAWVESNPGMIKQGIVVDFVRWYQPDALDDSPLGSDGGRITFEVPSGASDAEIGHLLYEKGLVRSELAFQYWVVQGGRSGNLQAGSYDLSFAGGSLSGDFDAVVE
jgi:hypothetical protein